MPFSNLDSRYDPFLTFFQGGIVDGDEEAIVKRLKVSIQTLAASFTDPVKASEDLHAFAKLNENRLYKLLKTCMDPQTDVKTLVKSTVGSVNYMSYSLLIPLL